MVTPATRTEAALELALRGAVARLETTQTALAQVYNDPENYGNAALVGPIFNANKEVLQELRGVLQALANRT